MTRLGNVVLLILCSLFIISNATATEAISQIKIHQMTKAQFLNMRTLGLDITEVKDGEFTVMAKPEDLQTLNQLQISYDVIHPDVAAFYESRNVAAAPFGGFRTLAQIEAYLDSLTMLYPGLCSPKFSIGPTYEGRQMWVVRISNNPTVEQGKPSVFYNSLIHAREPEGAAMLLNFMQYLLSNYGVDTAITNLIDNRELYFLPVVNPDGYYYNQTTNPNGGGMWRKNRRPLGGTTYGIDLNRNFGFKWGIDEYGSSGILNSEVYRGSSAFSEPETQNMRNFIATHNFSIVHNIHTYANLVLWPYGYDRVWSNKDDFYQNLGDSMTQVNHYTPQVSWLLYPTNGDADDWAWGDTLTKPRTITLTTEIGNNTDGFWPSVSRIPVLSAENLQAELFLARVAANPYIIGPPTEPSPTVADSNAPAYTVHWHDTDTINVPTSYRLYELTGKQIVTDNAEADYGYWDKSLMAISTAQKHLGNASWFMQAGDAQNS
ncbi:MAG TPA: M14 family metallopeptidase, partial [Candidatus Acidoferrum sp.]|nr:M14 family metallopeptidase [Candidatus Acidoferrum sp.]